MYVKDPFTQNKVVSPAEKRHIERRHLIFYLRVWDASKNILLGHVADVSIDGFMLVGETRIEADTEFTLKMKLPSISGDAEPLEFKAVSCWSSNDVNQQFFDTGFQFSQISDETIARINKLIDEYGMNS